MEYAIVGIGMLILGLAFGIFLGAAHTLDRVRQYRDMMQRTWTDDIKASTRTVVGAVLGDLLTFLESGKRS